MAHILVIDDEQSICDILKLLFQKEGYEVLTANTGQDALTLLEKECPPLIFCDINMPEMNGFEFIEKMRSLKKTPAVIMVTAYADKPKLLEALRLGTIDYVTKPFRIEELRVKIRLWMEIGKRHSLGDTSAGQRHLMELLRLKNNSFDKLKR